MPGSCAFFDRGAAEMLVVVSVLGEPRRLSSGVNFFSKKKALRARGGPSSYTVLIGRPAETLVVVSVVGKCYVFLVLLVCLRSLGVSCAESRIHRGEVLA